MDVYKNSFASEDEFDFEDVIPYFKNSIDRTRSEYESLMDSFFHKIQCLPEPKRIKYTKFMVNIITYSRIVENEIKNMGRPAFESDVESTDESE